MEREDQGGVDRFQLEYRQYVLLYRWDLTMAYSFVVGLVYYGSVVQEYINTNKINLATPFLSCIGGISHTNSRVLDILVESQDGRDAVPQRKHHYVQSRVCPAIGLDNHQ